MIYCSICYVDIFKRQVYCFIYILYLYQNGIFSAIPYICFWAFINISGLIADYMRARGIRTKIVRKIMILFGMKINIHKDKVLQVGLLPGPGWWGHVYMTYLSNWSRLVQTGPDLSKLVQTA